MNSTLVAWSFADESRGMDSRGPIKPSLMREVISDVVESRSGYVNVSFELPVAGGFRVMDVIVIEITPLLSRTPPMWHGRFHQFNKIRALPIREKWLSSSRSDREMWRLSTRYL